jgi:3'(2'), 5'-bisphosphate nucleotidase
MSYCQMNEHSLELTTALAAVELACTLCRQMQRQRAIKSIDKDDRSPVTVADFASQAIICHTLTGAFPSDPIIGEESSQALAMQAKCPLTTDVLHAVARFIPGISQGAL